MRCEGGDITQCFKNYNANNMMSCLRYERMVKGITASSPPRPVGVVARIAAPGVVVCDKTSRASRRRSSRRAAAGRRRGSGIFFELEPTLQPNLTNSVDRPGAGVSVSDGGSFKEGPSWPQVCQKPIWADMLQSREREQRRRVSLGPTKPPTLANARMSSPQSGSVMVVIWQKGQHRPYFRYCRPTAQNREHACIFIIKNPRLFGYSKRSRSSLYSLCLGARWRAYFRWCSPTYLIFLARAPADFALADYNTNL